MAMVLKYDLSKLVNPPELRVAIMPRGRGNSGDTITVDWGDDSAPETINYVDFPPKDIWGSDPISKVETVSHLYSSVGIYNIRVTGSAYRFSASYYSICIILFYMGRGLYISLFSSWISIC